MRTNATRLVCRNDSVPSSALEESLSSLLNDVSLCSVATMDESGPWVSTLYFAFDGRDRLVVLTDPHTRHAQAWAATGVAVAVSSTDQPF